MPKIISYDWSSLDRNGLINLCILSRKLVVNKNLTAKEITKIFRKQFKNNGIPLKIKTKFELNVPKNKAWVGAVFDANDDKKKKKSITLDFFYRSNQDLINFNYNDFYKLCYDVADTVLHEIIHMRQFRRRNYKNIKGYTSYAESSRQRKEQEYLGHGDEIDAYAFNIACVLNDNSNNSKSKSIKYINKALKEAESKDNSYTMYLRNFNYDHTHKVIKKLKKRIAYYLPYAELGKPYKTKDWLTR